MRGLGLNDMSREVAHLLRVFHFGDVLEDGVGAADFVGVVQGRPDEACLERFEQEKALPPSHDNPGKIGHSLLADGIPDYRECLLCDPVVRREIIRCVEVAFIDLRPGDEAFDLDRVGALDANGIDFLVFDHHEAAFANRIAFHLILSFHGLARLWIDELPLDTVSGLAVEGIKANA